MTTGRTDQPGHGGQRTLIGDRYELGELLGRGGMAEVRKGTDTRLGRVVAIKRLRTDLASDPTFQARFRREAQSSASLNHPAIVAVYDTGEEPTADGALQPYIVMEHVAGRTLRDILREGRKILPERALEITSGVLSALDYSHRAGIIHRDIKPGNVMLTPSGDIKVMDFGIARAISDAASSMTQTAAVVGTAQYLSPEQARGETVDSRSDVYSAGCLLYELLTGRPPFVGDSPVAVAYQHVREPATPPSHFDADLTPEIDTIVMKALAKRVEDRYQSAAAMRTDIERYLAGRPVQAVVAVPPAESTTTRLSPATAVTAPVSETSVRGTPVPPARPQRSGKLPLILILLLLLVLILITAFVVWPKLFPSGPTDVKMPSVVGMDQQTARDQIVAAGFTPTGIDDTQQVCSDKYPVEGTIVQQDPAPDAYVATDSSIVLEQSRGACSFTLPDVTQDARQAAINTLIDQGVPRANIKIAPKPCTSDFPKGTVATQDPNANTTITKQDTVTLCLSAGPNTVPNVIGLQEDKATKKLIAAHFNPIVRDYTGTTTKPKGTVVDQSPTGGKGHTGTQGSNVYIYVSTYVPPPDADGDGLSDAQEAQYGTDPNVADSDGDGLSDGDEVKKYHTDPLNKDSDGDTFTDGDEVTAGSDPNDPTSTPLTVGTPGH
ncbi:MAG TPA: Stk1 family PASTA domain-containing Ser/Thr kinase [Nocardioides sp.]|nr:Stk1 family PASTA domain-containing Ser/Thr kinase [Nocardioides sp.]